MSAAREPMTVSSEDAPSPRHRANPGIGNGLIVVGYVCAIISLGLFPPAFGLIGTVIGILALARGRIVNGVILMALSVIFGFVGMAIGQLMWGGF